MFSSKVYTAGQPVHQRRFSSLKTAVEHIHHKNDTYARFTTRVLELGENPSVILREAAGLEPRDCLQADYQLKNIPVELF